MFVTQPHEWPRRDPGYLSQVEADWYPLKPTVVFPTYWYFAAERQAIFYRRLEGQTPPWTEDPIFQRFRFTNAYRASDRVSQYLIRHVIYGDSIENRQSEEDLLFRIMLFKVFNRIETWELLQTELGEISWSNYSFCRYDRIVTSAMEQGQPVFSSAYIMPSGRGAFGELRKHRNYLRILELMMEDNVPARLAACRSLKQVYELLLSYPAIGRFLAYQYAVDLNYSPLIDFDENSFVVAGPGARDGIAKCFTNAEILSPERVIHLMCERQEKEFARLGIEFPSLWGRPLQPVDCQNLFCEVDKYARVAHPAFRGPSGRRSIKRRYNMAHRQQTPPPWYPPAWGINDRIADTFPVSRRR